MNYKIVAFGFCLSYVVPMMVASLHIGPFEENGSGREDENCKSAAQQAFDAVPESDRTYFITLHLALGLNERISLERQVLHLPEDVHIPLDIYASLQSHDTPTDFSIKLLEWTEQVFKLTDDQVLELVQREKVCYSLGHCIDPDDVGSLCCPFSIC